MRFLGCVFDYGIAIGQNSGQHNVHGGADANYVKINLSAVEMAFGGPGMDKAAFDFHFCAHGGKACGTGRDAAVQFLFHAVSIAHFKMRVNGKTKTF